MSTRFPNGITLNDGSDLDDTIHTMKQGVFKSNTIVLFGDSITNQNSNMIDDVGYFTWANIFLGQRFSVLNYAGVTGNTIDQMLARIQPDVLDYKPKYCMFMGAINNVRGGDSSSTIISKLQQVYGILTANNISIITSTLTPANAAGGVDTVAKKQVWYEVNDWIRRNAQNSNNIFLVEMGKSITDPSTSDPLANIMTAGLHPGTPCAFLMGKELANKLSNVIKPIELFSFSNGDAKVLNANPMMLGDVTGKATGCTITGGTNTPSKVVRTDGCLGELQRIDSTTTTEVVFQTDTVTTGFSVGDTIYVQAEIAIGTITNLKKISCVLRYLDSSNAILQSFVTLNHQDVNFDLDKGNWNGVLKTYPAIVPANTTKMYAQIRFTGIAVVDIGRIELRKV